LATGRTGCTDEKGGPAGFDEDSYFYCNPDGMIYVGEKMMWQLYTEAGPIAPALDWRMSGVITFRRNVRCR